MRLMAKLAVAGGLLGILVYLMDWREVAMAIRRADLTAANLADALTTLTSPGMAHRAVVVATRLAREDGVGTAVELLGNYLANSGG